MRGIKQSVFAVGLLAMAVGCGGGEKKVDSADDVAADQATWSGDLKAGTSVCLAGTAGVRYVLEDALSERSLELAEDCIAAAVELEETGEEGAWELKYRAIGEKWESCKSQEQERTAFLGECLGSLGASTEAAE